MEVLEAEVVEDVEEVVEDVEEEVVVVVVEEEEEEEGRDVGGVDFLTKYSALVGAVNREERLDEATDGARTGRKARAAVIAFVKFCLPPFFFSAERRPLRCPDLDILVLLL